jgi:hypothetical protein
MIRFLTFTNKILVGFELDVRGTAGDKLDVLLVESLQKGKFADDTFEIIHRVLL